MNADLILHMFNKRIVKELAYTILLFILFWVLLELSARFIMLITKGPENIRRDVISDTEFGWALPVQAREKVKKNRCGETLLRVPSKHKLINKFPKYHDGKKIL